MTDYLHHIGHLFKQSQYESQLCQVTLNTLSITTFGIVFPLGQSSEASKANYTFKKYNSYTGLPLYSSH